MAHDADVEQPAEVLHEYGPFEGPVHGVTWDGERVWFAQDAGLRALDVKSGAVVRTLPVPSDAGTAFDGQHLYQLSAGRILKLDARSGEVLRSLPAPGDGGASGLTWAEGRLWVGQYRDRALHQVDPETGAVLRTLRSDRFVTGVTWVDGELWHATLEGDTSDLRRVDPEDGRVLERRSLPDGVLVSGLESDGGDVLYAGGAGRGTVRAVRRPRRRARR